MFVVFLPSRHPISNLQLKREEVLTKSLKKTTDKPNEDPNIRGDPFKTLIAARLSYDADEHDLEKEFGRFGPIERVCILIITCYLEYCYADQFIRRFVLSLIRTLTRRETRRRSRTVDMLSSYLNVRKT